MTDIAPKEQETPPELVQETPPELAQTTPSELVTPNGTSVSDLVGDAKEDKPEEPQDPRLGLPPTVQVLEGQGPMVLQKSDPTATGPWIQYNGIGTVRMMGPADWKAAGVASDKTVQWSYMNKKRVSRHAFSDEELQYLLLVDGRFSLVED